MRIIRLSDCFIYHMENPRGARKIYPVLCFGFKVSKRNAFQRVEHAGCVRHLDPSLCPVGYTAYQVVHMFLSNPALIPDMSKDRTWYDQKLCCSIKGKEVAYQQQANMLSNYFGHGLDQCRSGNKKTHISRTVSARTLDNQEVSSTGRDLAGRWKQDSHNAVYSVGFHAEPMKVLGGHDKNQPFPILDRDLLDPPKELLLRTFPWISKCRTVISDNLLSGRFKTEVTGENFLELCSILMIVYYQDAAVRLYEDPSLKEHHVFKINDLLNL